MHSRKASLSKIELAADSRTLQQFLALTYFSLPRLFRGILLAARRDDVSNRHSNSVHSNIKASVEAATVDSPRAADSNHEVYLKTSPMCFHEQGTDRTDVYTKLKSVADAIGAQHTSGMTHHLDSCQTSSTGPDPEGKGIQNSCMQTSRNAWRVLGLGLT